MFAYFLNCSPGRGNARMRGYSAASGDVIVFVDGLAEVNKNWLSPLVLRLLQVSQVSLFSILYRSDVKEKRNQM